MAETRNRGFASMDREKQRAIASKGGKAAHQQGTAHEFTPEEARMAGRKGGERVSRNREHMSNIGRLGGEASRNSRSRQGTDSLVTSEQGVGESIASAIDRVDTAVEFSTPTGTGMAGEL